MDRARKLTILKMNRNLRSMKNMLIMILMISRRPRRNPRNCIMISDSKKLDIAMLRSVQHRLRTMHAIGFCRMTVHINNNFFHSIGVNDIPIMYKNIILVKKCNKFVEKNIYNNKVYFIILIHTIIYIVLFIIHYEKIRKPPSETRDE